MARTRGGVSRAAPKSEEAMPPPMKAWMKKGLFTCMMCPLCNKVLDEATTISKCLHTFCRKCIFEKLTDEEVDCCPVCKLDLGCVPVEKLRTDHKLQVVIEKLFPFKRRKVYAPEVPSVSLPSKRKERSLSSLVVNTLPVGKQTGLTGRRTNAAGRRAAGISPANNGSNEDDEANAENCAENSNSPAILNKIAQNRRQNPSNAGTSSQTSNIHKENEESQVDEENIWNPLDCLAEAAKLEFIQQSPVIMAERNNGPEADGHISKTEARGHPNKSTVQPDKNSDILKPSEQVKPKRLRGISRKRKELETSAQALLDAVGGKHGRMRGPIWFSLVPAVDQDGNALLPQLSANFLRVKDGNLPASFIKKYLVKKLNLASETEVDITCQGQLVDPTMPLHGLVDMQRQTVSSQKTVHSVGSSAKEFVMVLTYRRKAPVIHCLD